MILTANFNSTFDNWLELAGLLVAFVVVVALAYFVTQWIAKSFGVQSKNKNITVIETYQITQNKYVQILKIGNKYIAIGVGKEEVNFLTEISSESVQCQESDTAAVTDFKGVLEKINETRKNRQNKKKKN